MKKFFVIVVLLIVLVLGLLVYKQGCSLRIRNVILISIDTCRADHLSCYGYKRKTTPNIDRIADEGILFASAISPVPLTLPGHSSMFTGTIPPYHGVHDNTYYILNESNVTLAELLKANGFNTASFISAFVLDSRFGLDQGFDSYNDEFGNQMLTSNIAERRGVETSRAAIEWLNKHNDERFFMFLHYFDPHKKYNAPEPFGSRFMLNPYAGEIAYTDHCIGQVIDKLKKLGLYDSTLIIITSDHGEMLGEHGENTHGYFIYDGNIKVPLIFKLPGKSKSRRIANVVGLVDIVPTICSVLGIKQPAQIQGRDLTQYFHGNAQPYPDQHLYTQSLEPSKYEAGVKYLSGFIKLEPGKYEGYNNLGMSLISMGRFNEAKEMFIKALEIYPDNDKAHFNLGRVLNQEGKYDEAIAHFRRAQQLSPNERSIQIGLNNAMKHKKIASIITQDLADDKKAEALDTLAAEYAAAGGFYNAIETLQKAIKTAGSSGREELARKLQNRLKIYRNDRPFTESLGSETNVI